MLDHGHGEERPLVGLDVGRGRGDGTNLGVGRGLRTDVDVEVEARVEDRAEWLVEMRPRDAESRADFEVDLLRFGQFGEFGARRAVQRRNVGFDL